MSLRLSLADSTFAVHGLLLAHANTYCNIHHLGFSFSIERLDQHITMQSTSVTAQHAITISIWPFCCTKCVVPQQHSTERACNISCILTSIGTQAHAAASLPPIAHCQNEQLPLHMQHLPIRDQLVPFVTGGSLPTGWGGLFFLRGLVLRRRSLLRVADLQSQRPSGVKVTPCLLCIGR